MPNLPPSHSEQMRAKRRRRADRLRPSASKRGYGRRWQKVRKLVLARDPLCRRCKREASCEVDHVTPMSEGGERFALENLQGLCKRCHSVKTATRDGGFGR